VKPKIPSQSFGSINVRAPLATEGARIGLLGGSFNPPHAGHNLISEMALKQLNLDQVWWLVSPGNPIKSHDNLLDLSNRIEQAGDVAHNKHIKITAFEAALPTNYTAQTVKFLKRRYGGVRFVWLMGADNLVGFHHWQQWQDIFMTLPIAVFDRPDYHLTAMASPAAHKFSAYKIPQTEAKTLAYKRAPAWVYLTHKLSSLSSTQLRKQK